MRLIGSLLIGCIFLANAFINQRVSVKNKPLYSQLNIDDDSLTTIANGVGLMTLYLPTIMRHNEACSTDEDCPFIMRCCELGQHNFCCTPNNYIKLSYAYSNQFIQHISEPGESREEKEEKEKDKEHILLSEK